MTEQSSLNYSTPSTVVTSPPQPDTPSRLLRRPKRRFILGLRLFCTRHSRILLLGKRGTHRIHVKRKRSSKKRNSIQSLRRMLRTTLHAKRQHPLSRIAIPKQKNPSKPDGTKYKKLAKTCIHSWERNHHTWTRPMPANPSRSQALKLMFI